MEKKTTESLGDHELDPKSNWRKLKRKRMVYFTNAKRRNSQEFEDYKNFVKNEKKMKKILFDLMGYTDLEEADRFKQQFNLIKRDSFIGKPSFRFLDTLKQDGINKKDGKPLLGVISEKSLSISNSTLIKNNNLIKRAFTPMNIKAKDAFLNKKKGIGKALECLVLPLG